VLPDALWRSTAGAHAFSARSEYNKNIARFLHMAVGVQKSPASVSRYPLHLLWPENPRTAGFPEEYAKFLAVALYYGILLANSKPLSFSTLIFSPAQERLD
jgi:hypothetical protein